MPEKCKDVMTPDPVCCVPADTVDKAAQLMRDQDIGPVPVCDREKSRKLIGMVTDRDLEIKVVAEGRNPKATRVEEVMSRRLVTCSPEDSIEKALDIMEQHQVRRIPVVDSAGQIVGIIAQADIATRVHSRDKTAEMVEEISRPRHRAGGA